MDIPALLANLPPQFRFFAKKGLFRIPFLGTHLRRAGHLPVDRSSVRASLKSMSQGARVIAERHISVLLFPEGGRAPEGLREFKEGAAYIAIKAGVPAVPIAIVGMRALLPMGSIHIRRGTATLRVGDPIPTAGLKLADRERLNERLYREVAELLADRPCQSKRYDSLAARARRGLQFLDQRVLQALGIYFHRAGRDLLVAGPPVAQLTYAQVLRRVAQRRPEGTARDGARRVQIAGARLGIQHRTGFVFRQSGEALFGRFTLVQYAGLGIAWEIGAQPDCRVTHAFPHAAAAPRIARLQIGQPLAQAHGIQLGDGKRAHAAFRASQAALEPSAALARGLAQGGIDDLYQVAIGGHVA
jgi:1-acyl-sn-glycerol-3-phosphate acyltransferase